MPKTTTANSSKTQPAKNASAEVSKKISGYRPSAQVGALTAQKNGDYHGTFVTMTHKADIIVYANPGKETASQPDYLVETSTGFPLGSGYINIGEQSSKEYIRLALSAPEIGMGVIYCNIAPAPGKKPDQFVLIWNG